MKTWKLKPGQRFETIDGKGSAEPSGLWDGTKFKKAPLSPEKEAAQAKQDAVEAEEAERAAKDALIDDLKARVEALEAPAAK